MASNTRPRPTAGRCGHPGRPAGWPGPRRWCRRRAAGGSTAPDGFGLGPAAAFSSAKQPRRRRRSPSPGRRASSAAVATFLGMMPPHDRPHPGGLVPVQPTSGRVTSRNTADLRLPGGRAAAANRFSGSCEPVPDLDPGEAPGGGGEGRQYQHAREVGRGLGGGRLGPHPGGQEVGQGLDRERGKVNGGPQRGRLLPLSSTLPWSGGSTSMPLIGGPASGRQPRRV